MKKHIEDYEGYEQFSEDVRSKFSTTYEENITDIEGYDQVPNSVKETISTHKLKYSPSMGSYLGTPTPGYGCENCGSSFILLPIIPPQPTNSPKTFSSYKLGEGLYLVLFTSDSKCTYKNCPN